MSVYYSEFFYYHGYSIFVFFFFFNDTATTEIYTLSLHDALPISLVTVGFTNASGTCCASTSTTAVERYNEGSDEMTLTAATEGSAKASTANHLRRPQTARRRSIAAPFWGSSSSTMRLNSSLTALSGTGAERSPRDHCRTPPAPRRSSKLIPVNPN